jgi:hypothetical protein
VPRGRRHIVTIGVDRYQHCGTLKNAVNDAKGALRAFTELGFQQRATLYDEEATGEALDRLVRRELRGLAAEDSLVVFFAGHGFTEITPFADGTKIRVGYLVPVDGDHKQPGTCLRLRTWLDELAHLPVQHILVILDSCKSGIALEPMQRWHNAEPVAHIGPLLEKLEHRRSRRVITSARDDQFASDKGPKAGHSLFTGFLLDGLAGGATMGAPYTTSTMIGAFVQQQVLNYPQSRQTPDFGVLQLDDHGELVMPFAAAAAHNRPLPEPVQPEPVTIEAPSPDRGRPPKPGKPLGGKGAAQATGTPAAPAPPLDPFTRPPRQAAASAPGRDSERSTDPFLRPPPRDPFQTPPRLERGRPATATREPILAPHIPGSHGVRGRPAPFAEPEATRDPGAGGFRDPFAEPEATRDPGAAVPLTFLAPSVPREPGVRSGWDEGELRPGAGALDRELVEALNQHAEQRAKRGLALSFIAGEPRHALASVATWAAQRGELTITTAATRLDDAVRDVLAHVPWFRCLPAARTRFARASLLGQSGIDAAIDSRNGRELPRWIDEVAAACAAGKEAVRVAGWLLASLRDPRDSLDETTAPLGGRELLLALAELAAPLAVCFAHEEPTAA